jgi:hypothetical protein
MGIKSSIFKKYHLNDSFKSHHPPKNNPQGYSWGWPVNNSPCMGKELAHAGMGFDHAWIKVSFFNQEIQNQIYKNYIFSKHKKPLWYSPYTKDIIVKRAKEYGLGLKFLISITPLPHFKKRGWPRQSPYRVPRGQLQGVTL